MSADYIHTITINAEKETVEAIRNFVRSDYHIFDFHNIIPLVSAEEYKNYRETRKFPRSYGKLVEERWGCMGNLWCNEFKDNTFDCLGGCEIYSVIIKELSRLFPEAIISYEANIDTDDLDGSVYLYEVYQAGELVEQKQEVEYYEDEDEDEDEDEE